MSFPANETSISAWGFPFAIFESPESNYALSRFDNWLKPVPQTPSRYWIKRMIHSTQWDVSSATPPWSRNVGIVLSRGVSERCSPCPSRTQRMCWRRMCWWVFWSGWGTWDGEVTADSPCVFFWKPWSMLWLRESQEMRCFVSSSFWLGKYKYSHLLEWLQGGAPHL